jgi:hypothetical protein
MYEGLTRLLIVFLTHPGVILDIPAPALWSWPRGLWQASWVLVMHSFSEGRNSTFAPFVYWAVLFAKTYINIRLILAGK